MVVVSISILLACSPPIGPIYGSKEVARDDIHRVLDNDWWVNILRWEFDTSSANNQFRPAEHMTIFAIFDDGATRWIPANEVDRIEMCDNPNAPVNLQNWDEILPNGNGNGSGWYYRFTKIGRHEVRVFYDGRYSDHFSLQVKDIGGGNFGGDDPDGGIHFVWSPLIRFNTDGGSAVPNQRIPYGSQVTVPAPPAKDGFTFGGWFSDAACTMSFDFNAQIYVSTTIYAKWD